MSTDHEFIETVKAINEEKMIFNFEWGKNDVDRHEVLEGLKDEWGRFKPRDFQKSKECKGLESGADIKRLMRLGDKQSNDADYEKEDT